MQAAAPFECGGNGRNPPRYVSGLSGSVAVILCYFTLMMPRMTVPWPGKVQTN